jgi:hypothetical protein
MCRSIKTLLNSPARDREVEASKARAKAQRFAPLAARDAT